MAKQFIKQHIIPETYLKHFSIGEDGKSLFVIDRGNKYRKNVQIKNSGDKIFWEKKYYNSDRLFPSSKLEKVFGTSIESFYNTLIDEIIKSKKIEDRQVKIQIIVWIYTSVNRRPEVRNAYKESVEIIKKLEKTFPGFKSDFDTIDKSIDDVAKDLHLNRFLDETEFKKRMNELFYFAIVKKWELLECQNDQFWITSDSPGYLIKFNDKSNSIQTDPTWNYEMADGLFFPLTKKYAIHMYPYQSGEPIDKNLFNSPIVKRKVKKSTTDFYNKLSFASMGRLIISPNEETLISLAKYLNSK